MTAPRPPRAVAVAILLGLVSFGASPLLIRYAGDTPALAIAAWRTLLVAGLMLPAVALTRRDEIRQLPAREWALAVTAGVFLGVHFVSWIQSVQLTSVASSSVLVTLSPVFIAVFGAVFLREVPRRRTWIAIAVAVFGAVLIGWGESGSRATALPNPALGNGLALLAALLVSVYLLIGRSVRQRTSVLTYFAILNAVAALTTVSVCLALGVELGLSPRVFGLCLLMALGPGLLGHGSFNLALAYYPAAFLGLLSLSEPVIASVGALVLFGEVPSPLTVVGGGIVLVAIATVVGARAED